MCLHLNVQTVDYIVREIETQQMEQICFNIPG